MTTKPERMATIFPDDFPPEAGPFFVNIYKSEHLRYTQVPGFPWLNVAPPPVSGHDILIYRLIIRGKQ